MKFALVLFALSATAALAGPPVEFACSPGWVLGRTCKLVKGTQPANHFTICVHDLGIQANEIQIGFIKDKQIKSQVQASYSGDSELVDAEGKATWLQFDSARKYTVRTEEEEEGTFTRYLIAFNPDFKSDKSWTHKLLVQPKTFTGSLDRETGIWEEASGSGTGGWQNVASRFICTAPK
jgi:hypothetical protein